MQLTLGIHLTQVASEKLQKPLQVWIRDLVNHFWFCCKQATTEVEFKVYLKQLYYVELLTRK